MDEKEKALKKIEKLLTLAHNSAATDNEVEQSLQRVAELVKRYGISADEIRTDSTGKAESVYEHRYIITHTKIYNWEKYLLHVISDTVMCQMLVGKKLSGDRLYTTVEFCGRSSDIAVAQYLYNYLRGVILKRSQGVPSNRDEFCQGIVYGLESKLDSFRVQVNALVPVGLDEYVEDVYPHIKARRSYTTTTGSTFIQGVSAANDISLNKAIAPVGIGS